MKYFIGIVPPPRTLERILTFQKSFPTNKVWRYNEPNITVKAPSGLTEDRGWLARVMVIIGNHKPFVIDFTHLDSFRDEVLFLSPAPSPGLIELHLRLVKELCPDEAMHKEFFEGDEYHPHLTLGDTSWGGMMKVELVEMRRRAEIELFNIPPFQVTFVRIYQKDDKNSMGEKFPYTKLIDIPLKFI